MAALAFFPTLAAPFHLDDYSILNDPVLTSSDGWWKVWRWTQVRPFAYFTLWLNHAISGAHPLGYHVTNWLIHLANVWLAWLALRRLAPERAALIAVALFALHPVQTESVAYVFARSTLLCSGFCLAALAAWLRGKHWWAVGLHALAMLAKEEAVALPVVLALLHFSISRNHREWRAIAAMLGVALLVGGRGLFVTSTQAGTGAVASAAYTPLEYWSAQGFVLCRYAAQWVAPFWLNFDPDLPVSHWLWWILPAALAAWSLTRFRQAGPGLWILVALAILAPTSTILPIDDLSADRRLYLAIAAAAMAVAPFAARAPRWLLLGALAAMTAVTVQRAIVWRTEESLWRDTVAKSPAKLRPRIQLARHVTPEEGLRLLVDRKETLAANERGRLYLQMGRSAEALKEFGDVLAQEPDSAAAITNRGVALAVMGQREAARADFERALKADPCFAPARKNLGLPPCATP